MSKQDRVLLPRNVLPSHYELELSPDLEALVYGGELNVKVTVSGEEVAVSDVTLHSKEITIKTASFIGADGATRSLTGISYDLKATTVKLSFDGNLPAGEGSLKISFSGILNGDMAGFYKSAYSDAAGNKKIMASTQFEALDARRALPCWDEPSVKATFTVIMVVPQHLTALSNMPEASTVHLVGGKKMVTFEVSPKMSTYLLAFCVGEFDYVATKTKNGVVLRVYSPPGRAEHGKFALDAGSRALDFFDSFFGIPYPLPKLDMICITEFAMGAMENWGLVTYREVALMIDEAKASPQAKQRVAIVVAHELAHQWFGNLVTMDWWDGLWLNEGFAAWMEHFAVDSLYPEYKIWEQFTTDALGAAQRLDSLKTSHPIIVPIKHAEEVEQVFDAISYCKGSCVVNMVFALLGRDQFQAGLQLYFKRHAYGNTETEDLWAAWSEASGIDVSGVMSTWTKQMGYPYLKVVSETWTATELKVTLEQDWFLSDGTVSPDSPVWSIPLLFSTPAGASTKAQLMTTKQQEFSVPLSAAGDWVKINAGQKALVRVLHSAQMTERLKAGLKNGTVTPVDRAAVLLDSYALVKAGFAPPENVVEILRALDNESSSIVWAAIQAVLSGLHLLLEQVSPAVFDSFKAFGTKLVLSALAKCGWDPKAGEGHTDKLLRASVLALLDTFCSTDPTVVAEAKRRFDGHFDDPSLLPSDYKTTVFKIVLSNGGEAEYERVLKTYYATEDNQERKYPLFSLGATNSAALKRRTLDWAVFGGDVKLQDFFYGIGSIVTNSEGVEMAWAYYQQHFAAIKEKLAKASPSLMDAVIINCTSRFCTAARADEIEAFFAANPLPSSTRRISQTIEVMRTNAAMLARIQKSSLANPAYF